VPYIRSALSPGGSGLVRRVRPVESQVLSEAVVVVAPTAVN